MPLVSNVGGSITGAVVATALALGARIILRRHARAGQGTHGTQQPPMEPPRFLGGITPAALRLLVETEAVPYVLIQVSQPDEPPALPPALAQYAVTLTTHNVLSVLLGPPSQWQTFRGSATGPGAYGTPPADLEPRQGELVCLVSSSAAVAHAAACALAANGFHRVTITITDPALQPHQLAGNTGSTTGAPPAPVDSASAAALWGGQAVQLAYIGRDGLAALLGYRHQPLGIPYVLLDLRRHDERALYGLIRGSVHVPVEQLPSALALSPDEFLALYRFPCPQPGAPLVLLGRTSRRAAWAAQVCEDAGLWPVLVYRQGTFGWRLDESVKPYRHYRVGDRPPEPDVFQPEMPDEAHGVEELVSLGLLPGQLAQTQATMHHHAPVPPGFTSTGHLLSSS